MHQPSSLQVANKKTPYPTAASMEKKNPYIKLVAKLQTTENGITKRKVGEVHTYNTVKHAQFFKSKEGITTASVTNKTHLEITAAASARSGSIP